MAEYLIEFKDASGSLRGSKFYSKPTDSEALSEGAGLLAAKRRSDSTVTRAVVWQRVIGVSDRANEVGELKP